MTTHGGQDVRPEVGNEKSRVGFKLHLRPTVVPGEAAYLVSRRGVTALHGEHAEVLVPLLDGTRGMNAVLQEACKAEPALEPEEVMSSLRGLMTAGLVRYHAEPAQPSAEPGVPLPRTDRAAEAYWDLAGLDGGATVARLARTTVRVLALTSPADREAVTTACRDSGVPVAGEDGEHGEAGFSLVLCDDYLSPALREIDAEHRASGRPWLIAKACGTDPWVGPVFRPDEGPCWSCLATRLAGHRRSEWPVRRALGLAGPPARPAAALPAGHAIALHLSVLETAKYLAGVRDASQSVLHTLDTLSLRTRAHRVTRLPQCPQCGDPGMVAARTGRPFVPAPRPKSSYRDGGHRALTPDQMLERHGHLVDPVTGIVKELRRAARTPDCVNSYLSGHNLAMGAHTLVGLRAGLRALSGGKGLTETEAKVSALCEAVERYSGTRHGDEAVVRDSLRALGTAAVHPNSCQLYDERQFRDRDRWNARMSRFQYVPERFDEDRVTEWTPVWSLTAGTQRLLPTSMLYYTQGDPSPDGLYADSNGNAAGSSPEDALVQGFLELVERDAVALWWYNRARLPAVDVDSFAEPYAERLRDGCRRLHRELWVLDLTSDLGIPVMAALSRRTDKPAEDVIFGFGAHFDPRLALRRALSEMGQMLPAVCEARADGSGYALDDPEPLGWWRSATVANQPYLVPDHARPARTPGSWVYEPRADLLDDVTAITELVAAHGMELLVLDQSRPDLGIPVVKVIVPGMRHFWARLGPGRLYDVPVALGRSDRPTPYEELNPVPLFV
ncbi:TOMM precursor leader peptide-binding protein [Streptomyces sp. GC420]|uniref:TOMM precursor leader peptide-binding protein n=1 Tax=Streptomyces sp. GC420 TaxID=2697568 RepID=UPI001414FD1D|nr:TOMM precursor leader peptide-binding protein [Streptomyces sp. GC420]NBM15592.1 TOMM precursor leader peptide-binding protein [Streptomyces sp. GC420]